MVVVKKEFLKHSRISFKGKKIPLGERSQQDINDLALLAAESKDPSLLRLFETAPDKTVLKKSKTDNDLKDNPLRTQKKSKENTQ